MAECTERRQLGTTNIQISPVGLGCWPIAGMTSLNVNDRDSLATLEASLDAGVNFLDTAYCYGADGESERLIAQVIHSQRDKVVVATKGGIHWTEAGERIVDGSPAMLHRQCDESLQRLKTDRVELLYLHAPDPKIPIAESAGALRELLEAGKIRSVGISNVTVRQLEEFQAVCPISAFQPPYNMLQRQIERDTLPWCQRHDVSVIVYWPLMKGLLAGRLPRSHRFAEGDGRLKYPMFQGEEWEKNQDFLDHLRDISKAIGKTVAQIVINWTIHQPGITTALCGAKRADQILETSGAMGWKLSPQHQHLIDDALRDRGLAITRSAV